MLKDIYNGLLPVHVINETVTSGGGAVVATDIDLRGFDGTNIVVDFGANGGDTLNGTNYFTVKVEHSNDGTTYTECDTSDILGATPASGVVLTVDDAAEDEAVYSFGYVGNRRYLQITITPNGTLTNGNPVTIIVIKGLAHQETVH